MQNLIGKTIANRYRVDAFLGRGGMAEVYKVWDTQRGVELALKMLHEDLALDKVFLRRFKREAETLAQLQHPNIVRFYGLEVQNRQAYMVLDYVPGESLKHKIYDNDDPLPLEEIQYIMRSLCSALGYAHKQGLVHCDLKPGNVLFAGDGTTLLADFGIARLTDAATATMVGAGTPAYMAPEQVKGLDPIPQTDIYALGVILFEMLTGGERPFTGEHATTTGTTSAKVRWEQVNLDPPSLQMINSKISSELETMVLKCLAKNPADRYQTPLELLKALEMAVVGEGEIGLFEEMHSPLTPQEESTPAPMESQDRSGLQSTNNQNQPKSIHWAWWVGLAGIIVVGIMIGITVISTQKAVSVSNTPKPTAKPTEDLASFWIEYCYSGEEWATIANDVSSWNIIFTSDTDWNMSWEVETNEMMAGLFYDTDSSGCIEMALFLSIIQG
jgi:serine/threonine-protein kinase